MGRGGMSRTNFVIFWAAIIVGASYMIPTLADWSGPEIIVWKVAGVALLALWAGLSARSIDCWLITAVMMFGAMGDGLLSIYGLATGAVAFVIGHCLAIFLYMRNRRTRLSRSQKALGIFTIPASLCIVWSVLHGADGWWHAAIYTFFVAGMAAAAWTSRFPRYRTGLGAMAFLASDLFIFANEGGLMGEMESALTIWPLYFAGQAMIVWGVVSTQQREI
jgi:uncharacterized membrane protein YhhN